MCWPRKQSFPLVGTYLVLVCHRYLGQVIFLNGKLCHWLLNLWSSLQRTWVVIVPCSGFFIWFLMSQLSPVPWPGRYCYNCKTNSSWQVAFTGYSGLPNCTLVWRNQPAQPCLCQKPDGKWSSPEWICSCSETGGSFWIGVGRSQHTQERQTLMSSVLQFTLPVLPGDMVAGRGALVDVGTPERT